MARTGSETESKLLRERRVDGTWQLTEWREGASLVAPKHQVHTAACPELQCSDQRGEGCAQGSTVLPCAMLSMTNTQ